MLVFIILGAAIAILSSIYFLLQLFKLVELDASYRGMKRPKLWAWLALSGQRGGGIILYLLKRRDYPRASMSDADFLAFQNYKRRALLSWCLQLVGLGVLLTGLILQSS